jgi:hypothetical protein
MYSGVIMTIKLFDRVKETTNTLGSGTITLVGAQDSFQPFSGVLTSGESTYYCIQNAQQFEIGQGTYGNNTLSRDVILDSSNESNKISIAVSSDVFIGYPASKSVYYDGSGNLGINNDNPQFQIDASGSINLTGDVVLTESADHAESPASGKGQIWLRSDTPNKLVFTDDTGADFDIGGSGVPFDQDLNTTDAVTFAGLTLTDQFLADDGLLTAPSISFASQPTIGLHAAATHNINLIAGESKGFNLQKTTLAMTSGMGFGWRSSDSLATGTQDTFLYRDDAGVIAQRNGTNAQEFRFYNTFTDASNYERGSVKWDTNVFKLSTEAAGTGVSRSMYIVAEEDLRLQCGVGDTISFYPANTNSFGLNSSRFYAVSEQDLGSATFKFGTVWASSGRFGASSTTPIRWTNASAGSKEGYLYNDAGGIGIIDSGSITGSVSGHYIYTAGIR